MNDKRLYYVDYLRVFVILSLIPYHAALTYSGLGDIYIKAPLSGNKLIPFILLTMPLENFFMTLLFFLAGISAFYAIKRKGSRVFVQDRIKKLLIPFLAGTVFLCPIQAYFMGLHNGFQGNFFSFIPEFFSLKIVDYLGYAHLWFLLYLMVIAMATRPLLSRFLKETPRQKLIIDFLLRKNNIYLAFLLIIIVETVLRPFFPGKQILIWDWANTIVYSSVYIGGFFYAMDPRFKDRLYKLTSIAIMAASFCLIIFFLIYYYWLVKDFSSPWLSVLWAFLKGIYECSLLVGLTGIGLKYLNRKSRFIISFSRASFFIYIFHLLPVTVISYLAVDSRLNPYIQFLIIAGGSYFFLFILFKLYQLLKKGFVTG